MTKIIIAAFVRRIPPQTRIQNETQLNQTNDDEPKANLWQISANLIPSKPLKIAAYDKNNNCTLLVPSITLEAAQNETAATLRFLFAEE